MSTMSVWNNPYVLAISPRRVESDLSLRDRDTLNDRDAVDEVYAEIHEAQRSGVLLADVTRESGRLGRVPPLPQPER